ncbi:MAG: DNA-3-methyladenine glycosylase [Clostridia bacterium]|nr:DNA-3-methyladenine glycosylase [Clostridia bacterium]
MKIEKDFFLRDVLQVAPELVGKIIAHRLPDGTEKRLRITETEAYRGETDTACHASRGRTKRTETLYLPGGTIYVYLCYGIHWLLNIVTGPEDFPQAALIRACESAEGPGKLTKALGVDGRFNCSDITLDPELWIEADGTRVNIILDNRVGIGYASIEDQERLWRFKKG